MGVPISASSSSPWATEHLVSLRPALHHLTLSLVSLPRKEAKRNDGKMIAPQGHLVTALKWPSKAPTCDRVPARPCAGGGADPQKLQSRGAGNECLAPPRSVPSQSHPGTQGAGEPRCRYGSFPFLPKVPPSATHHLLPHADLENCSDGSSSLQEERRRAG